MITIGADPEVFVKDDTGQVVSAIGIIGGTKEKPKATIHLKRKKKYTC